MMLSASEALRRSYLPATIRVLFVGESPPAGGTFFYAANSNLSRYTQLAFEGAYEREWESGESFLRFFQALGCYLDDLCLAPVNRMTPKERRASRATWVPSFAERLENYRPEAIISVMSGTRPNVEAAIQQSDIPPAPTYFMPFPTFGHQRRYVDRLSETLRELQDKGVLPKDL